MSRGDAERRRQPTPIPGHFASLRRWAHTAAKGQGPQLDRAAIRVRLEEMTPDLRASLVDGGESTRNSVLALLAEDDHGKRRIDVPPHGDALGRPTP